MNDENNNINNQMQNNGQDNYYSQGINNGLTSSNNGIRGINESVNSNGFGNGMGFNNTNQSNLNSTVNNVNISEANSGIGVNTNMNTNTNVGSDINSFPNTSYNVTDQNHQAPIVTEQSGINNSSQSSEKGGKLRPVLLVLFFAFLLAFVMFLPDISKFLQGGIGTSSDNELRDGVLVCTMEKNEDITSVSYQMEFRFVNKELLNSTFNITTESENKTTIRENYNECKNLEVLAQDLSGIDVTCSSSDNINTMLESYNYRLIDTNGLTSFTEAGGTYPEYKYKENIYDIKGKMINAGYDCKEKAS